MGLRINTNAQSLAAQRALGHNLAAERNSQEKLSSGTRINRSADDAAGLAISEKIRADVRSIRQAVRNANDGISIITATEGGMAEIGKILVRFRELSIQAASDTLGDLERGFIDKEVQQLAGEVDHIADSVEFNGRIKLMNGEGDPIDIQIGIKDSPDFDRLHIEQSETDTRLVTLGLSGFTIKTKEDAQENLEKLDNAIRIISERRASLGALENRLHSTVNNLQIYDENLSGARSRIYDADFASETTEMTKNKILSEAGTMVLAQANHSTELALKLLT